MPLILLLGVPPIYTVPAILLSKTILGLISGGIHCMAGNVQSKVVLPLIITGILGTFLGVPVIFFLSEKEVRVFIGIILMLTGCLCILNVVRGVKIGKYSQNKIRATGFFAGFVNGISGGGYGAISTTGLITAGVKAPMAVGSTVLSETVVALSGLVIYSSFLREINWEVTLVLLIGGAIATPIGVLTTKISPSRTLGLLIGVIVMFLGVSSSYVQSEALVLGLLLIILMFITYHFKMIGYLRLRVAMGGVNLGIGVFVILLIYLNQTGVFQFYIQSQFIGLFLLGLILVSAIFIMAGILGVFIERRL